MDTLEKTRIEIWPFMCLFGGYTGNLGPIDFLFGLPINRIINSGQNKCGQNSQLKAQNRPNSTFEPGHYWE